MKRTTVMLPEELHRRATADARKRGLSLGELIGLSLDATLEAISNESEKDPLFEDVVFDGSAPSDTARNHNERLYDEEG